MTLNDFFHTFGAVGLFIVLFAIAIFIVLINSIYQIHISVNNLTKVQAQQNEILKELIRSNKNATEVGAECPQSKDISKLDLP